MEKLIKRYFFFLLLICLVNEVSPQSPHEAIRTKLDSLTHCSFFDTATISVTVFNPVTGKNVYSYNENKLLMPASNMKIVTSATALVFLGAEHPVSTIVLANTASVQGEIRGDIWLKGGGDPDFSVADIDTLIAELKRKGIARITGAVVADESLFDTTGWGKGWMWDDASSTDAPFITALPLNKNTLQVTVLVKEGKIVATPLPYTPFINFVISAVPDSTKRSRLQIENCYPYPDNSITIKGRINPADTVTEEINILHPARFCAEVFRQRCIEQGITIEGVVRTGAAPAGAMQLAAKTRTVAEILIDLNKQSRNLSAEILMRLTATKYKQKEITDDDGIKMVDSLILLTGRKPADYRIADGSGLSRYNLVSSGLLTDILKTLFYRYFSAYQVLRSSFPVIGVDGTLRRRMKDTVLAGNVYAKTGTLSGVSCLSGYIHTQSGEPLIFSMLMQNHVGMLARCYQIQHEILQTVSGY